MMKTEEIIRNLKIFLERILPEHFTASYSKALLDFYISCRSEVYTLNMIDFLDDDNEIVFQIEGFYSSIYIYNGGAPYEVTKEELEEHGIKYPWYSNVQQMVYVPESK